MPQPEPGLTTVQPMSRCSPTLSGCSAIAVSRYSTSSAPPGLYQVTVALVGPATTPAELIMPAWNLMLAQSLSLAAGVGVGETVLIGRKPLGNGVGDEYEIVGVGTPAAGPPVMAIHGVAPALGA